MYKLDWYYKVIAAIFMVVGFVWAALGMAVLLTLVASGHTNFGNMHFAFESLLQSIVGVVSFVAGRRLLKGNSQNTSLKILVVLLSVIFISDLGLLHYMGSHIIEVSRNYLMYFCFLVCMVLVVTYKERKSVH